MSVVTPSLRERIAVAWSILRGEHPETALRADAPPVRDAALAVTSQSKRVLEWIPPSKEADDRVDPLAAVPKPTLAPIPISSSTATIAPAMQGGRQTLPLNANPFGLGTFNYIPHREYQTYDLSQIDISQYDSGQLLAILADLNPDVSGGLWNTLRLAGVDITFQVTNLAGEDDADGQAYVDALRSRLGRECGGFDGMIGQLLLTAYLQGAIALDIAPTPALDDIEDFYVVNPSTIYYQRGNDQELIPYQRQIWAWGNGTIPYRRLNTELFDYAPIDPYPDEPYGRPPAAPVLQIVFFQIQVLRDLQRVIHAQGWPKIDISVLTEVIEKAMPPDVRVDARKKAAFVAARLNEVVTAYNGMNPEDAFVHQDYVSVSSGAVKAGSNLFDVQALLTVIRVLIIRGLKQLPTLMGEHVGSTETYSEIELTVFTKTINTFRVPIGRMLSRAFTVALRLYGLQGAVKETWPQIEIYDPLTKAKAMSQVAINAAFQRDQGWITQDQAAEIVTGTKAVGPAPPIGAVNYPVSSAEQPRTGREAGELVGAAQ